MPASAKVKREGFRLEPGHRDGCWMAEKDDPEAFIVYDGWDNRKQNGHRGGSQWWHRFRCNDPDCPAVMLVRADVLARFVTGEHQHGFPDRLSATNDHAARPVEAV